MIINSLRYHKAQRESGWARLPAQALAERGLQARGYSLPRHRPRSNQTTWRMLWANEPRSGRGPLRPRSNQTTWRMLWADLLGHDISAETVLAATKQLGECCGDAARHPPYWRRTARSNQATLLLWAPAIGSARSRAPPRSNQTTWRMLWQEGRCLLFRSHSTCTRNNRCRSRSAGRHTTLVWAGTR